ncbi:endonuclease/exonuclease/phosphatase family protein [Azospirillum brasilense]|uniref:endonuclease/exonuclease/phosphatase family protein n=1 Tax=Azospirillum brasilense TaxID=192 RepID=UPI0010C0479A|nr:endonuclease/exonuclease/phosphatase family protein [Azospirillum brasilense]
MDRAFASGVFGQKNGRESVSMNNKHDSGAKIEIENSAEIKSMVICGYNTFGWDRDKIAELFFRIFEYCNENYNEYQKYYDSQIVEYVKNKIDIFCVQEAGCFNHISLLKSYKRFHCDWRRRIAKKYLKEIKLYVEKVYDQSSSYQNKTKEYYVWDQMKKWEKQSYEELLNAWGGVVDLRGNSRCSIGIMCKEEDAVDIEDRKIHITDSVFHRPILGLTYRGLPVYSVHAPASNKDAKKAAYIENLIKTMIRMHNKKWIVVGDFNYNPLLSNDILKGKLENGRFLEEYTKICAPNEPTQNSGGTLDYAIHGSGVSCKIIEVLPSTKSDHRPVLYEAGFAP